MLYHTLTLLQPTKYDKIFVENDCIKNLVEMPLFVYNKRDLILLMPIRKERMQQEIWFQKYQILGLLGKGSNAEVYLAEHIKLNSFRAIKFISKNHPLYELQSKEAFVLKNLKHSCIPIIYDIEENEDGSYIIEQYLEGETLKDIIREKGVFREDKVIRFGLQLCDLIRYLHNLERAILYVDLKPDNILICEDTLKIVDFGSAIYRDQNAKQTAYFATKGYAAPELYENNQIDERCDVYGIGCLLYYMATGQSLIHRETARHIDYYNHCSRPLRKVISHCLKYQPSQRYASVEKLYQCLSEINHKNKYQSELSHTVKIAIGGSHSGIGVTHMAFRICNYLTFLKKPCLYQEKNESGCVWSMKTYSDKTDIHNGFYIAEGIPMLPNIQCTTPDITQYRCIVQDFGVVTPENSEDFLAADIRFYVLGAKEWEMERMKTGIQMLGEENEIVWLFNYLNGKQFQKIIQAMNLKNSYRVPYEPDPFTRIKSKSDVEFFREILGIIQQKI